VTIPRPGRFRRRSGTDHDPLHGGEVNVSLVAQHVERGRSRARGSARRADEDLPGAVTLDRIPALSRSARRDGTLESPGGGGSARPNSATVGPSSATRAGLHQREARRRSIGR